LVRPQHRRRLKVCTLDPAAWELSWVDPATVSTVIAGMTITPMTAGTVEAAVR
jgi:hypothetical protein